MYCSINWLFLAPYPDCKYDRVIASQPTSFDMVVPECDADGTYKAIQCYTHKMYGKWCWCVDIFGLEIIGTRAANNSLSEEHCLEARKGNTSSNYWTAFYQNPTRKPKPPVIARIKPIRLVKGMEYDFELFILFNSSMDKDILGVMLTIGYS